MDNARINKEEFTRFLKWGLPKLNLRWSGFRKVQGTVRKRVSRRMRVLDLPTLAAYRDRLEAEPTEWLELDRMCRIPISRFYRDKAVFASLTTDLLPTCAKAALERGDKKLRVLSAGCASGEEPYSVSLIWRCLVAPRFPGVDLEILAIDSDEKMLNRAKTACYTSGSFRDLPAELMQGGFTRSEDGYCLRGTFRDGVRFVKQDLRVAVPAGPFDLIFCRNVVFTYFDELHQAQAFEKLDAGLRDGGFLVVGSHEALPPRTTRYARIQPGLPVFRKIGPTSGSRQDFAFH